MSTLKLVAAMALLVVAGSPMVWYLWEVLNELLSGRVHGLHTLMALPVLLVFLGLLLLVSQMVHRWEGSATE